MPTKRPITRLRDIVRNGQAILEYTEGLDFEAYEKHQLVKDGSERCVSRISEAAVKLGSIAEDLFPGHDWRGIRDIGNVLRHAYPDIVDVTIWLAITKYLPPLLVELETFLAHYPEEQETL